MIAGTVARLRPIVNLVVRGPHGHEGTIEFLLDTGFTGAATLPPAACRALQLSFARLQPIRAAGGRAIVEVYEGTVFWDDTERRVEVLAVEGSPLLGMTLLKGSEVRLQVVEGGAVTITPL